MMLCSFTFASGYISKIESNISFVNPKLIRKTDKVEYLKVGDTINDNDLIITSPVTKAQFKFDNLTIDIGYGSELIVKQAILREKAFKANFNLKKGNLKVSFNSKKYNEKELSIETEKLTAFAIGTKFDISSNGFISVEEGIVLVKDKNGNKLKTIENGQAAGLKGPIITPKKREEFVTSEIDHDHKIDPNRDKNREPLIPKDKESKKREPAITPDSKQKKQPRK